MEERFRVFDLGLSTLAWRMDKMEITFLHLWDPRRGDPGPAQPSTSDYVNLRRPIPNEDVLENNIGNFYIEMVPMENEEEPLNFSVLRGS